MKKLKVLARGKALVTDFNATHSNVKRFIGRRWDESLGGWPALKEPTTVPALTEYILAVRDGELWPADQDTAKECGVKFDPKFGSEFEQDNNLQGK